MVHREDLGELASESIDLPPASELDRLLICFITRRNTILPPVAKLTPAQGAAAFMLGESVHTSGSNPRRAGESIREVGTNPFIIGDEAFEGNRFYEILCNNADKIDCYQLNTGGVGEILEVDERTGERIPTQQVKRVAIAEMAAIIRGIVREEIEWEDEPIWGTQLPKAVEGVTLDSFNPHHFYTQEQIATRGRTGCIRSRLEKFPGLHRTSSARSSLNAAPARPRQRLGSLCRMERLGFRPAALLWHANALRFFPFP